MSSLILHWTLYYCTIFNIDPRLAFSVIKVESNGDRTKIGSVGEVGLFQIRDMNSSYSAKALIDLKINIKEGVRLLAQAKQLCKHKLDNTFVVCFNRGLTGGSRVQYPKQDKYYKNVMKAFNINTVGGLNEKN